MILRLGKQRPGEGLLSRHFSVGHCNMVFTCFIAVIVSGVMHHGAKDMEEEFPTVGWR